MKEILGLLTILVISTGVSLAQKTITPEMIADIEMVTSVALSPDGEQIAYTLRIPGGEDDKPGTRHNELWTISTDGGTPKKLIGKPQSVFNITWGNNEMIYFLSRRTEVDENTQIYSIRTTGGEAQKVTGFENSIGDYALSPDGKKIAFTSNDPQTAEEKKNAGKGKDWIVLGKNYKYTRLYVYDLNSGNAEMVFGNDLNVTHFTWAPDGKTLVFSATEIPETDHIYMFQKLYRVETGKGEPVVIAKTEGKLGNMTVSPDGKQVAWAGAVDIHDPLAQSLFVAPLKGGDAKNLTKGYEGSVNSAHWIDEKTILILTAEGVYSALYRVDAGDGSKKSILSKGPVYWSVNIKPGEKTYAAVGNTIEHPVEVYSGSLKKENDFKRLTFNNKHLKNVKLSRQEVIEWKGPDGMKIQGILTYPYNYEKGKKYPLLLQIHGGPEGISYYGWNSRAVYPVQWYAANGYFVLEPNYRGSQGRGVDFAKADQKDLAGKEFQDILNGIDFLVNQGLVDKDHVGTGGFSYGGYLSAWAATKYSSRFKAAMMGAGISNWISFTGTTDIIYENSLVHWNLWWFDEMELVWDRSPLSHINNAATPTLIVHGDKDDRVPLSQSYELYNALKVKDVPVNMVIYKRQPHGIHERAAQIDFMQRTLDWFDKYVK